MDRSIESLSDSVGDGSAVLMSFSEVSEDKEYDEEELKMIASNMSPAVSSLLESNEAALDHLLAKNHQTWLEEEKKFGAKRTEDVGSDEEDGIGDELNRLAGAEQLLRDELEMSNVGFSFLSYMDGEGSEEDSAHDIEDDIMSNHEKLEFTSNTARSFREHERENESGKCGNEVDPEKQADHEFRGGAEATIDMNDSHEQETSTDDHSSTGKSYGLKSSEESSSNRLKSYSLYDHAKYIGLNFDDTDLGYPTCPLLTKGDAALLCNLSDSVYDSDDNRTYEDDVEKESETKTRFEQIATLEIEKSIREYVKPMSSSALCRIYAGLEEGKRHTSNNSKSKGKKNDLVEEEKDDVGISIKNNDGDTLESKREIIPVRTVAIQVRPDVLVGAVMDATYKSIKSLNGEVTKRQGGHLRALIPGRWVQETDYIPFRNHPTVDDTLFLFGSPMSQSKGDIMNGMVFLPPMVIDAQLCTKKKSIFAERILLVRAYKISEGQVLDDDAAVCPRSPPHASITHRVQIESDHSKHLIRPNHILRESSSLFQRMKTVATLGGRIAFDAGELLEDEAAVDKVPSTNGTEIRGFRKLLASPMKFFSPTSQKKKLPQTPNRTPQRNKQKALNIRFETEDRTLIGRGAAQKLASKKLLSSFMETPSVMGWDTDMDPIAALSESDWPYIQSAWMFLAACLNELDNLNLSFSSLVSCAFGAFPSLPTLDVHYCSQIKEICKENMVASLLKSARDLETYAKEAEYATAKLMQVLEPMLLSYDEELPQIPEKVPLTAYPLDFIAPEVASPPWGQKVIEALNLIAAKSPSSHGFHHKDQVQEVKADCSEAGISKTEFQVARESVNLVLNAFQKQYDDELSVRLGRKNCQVMDRLAKMQAYRREALMVVRGSYGINNLATKAADKFHSYAKSLSKSDSNLENDPQPLPNSLPASDQVPLLSCRVIYGGSTGICYVTYYELLLVMHSIPLVGGSQIRLVRLSDIDIEIKAGKKSRLNPVPSMLVVKMKHDAKELFSFRPSTGAHLFKDFVEIVKVVSQESPEAVNFSSENRLLSMMDEKRSVASAALGEHDTD